MPSRAPKRACVLVVSGLDPGGGAGILADARAVARAGAYACAAVSIVTVQSTSGLREAHPIAASRVVAQAKEVISAQHVAAFKIGALGSEENARAVGDLLAIHRRVPAIVDTVMLPTRGRGRLLEERGVGVLRERVLPRAALVTANAPEAEVLTGLRVTRLGEAHDAALAMIRLGARAVLLKGGHLGGERAVDVLAIAGAAKPTELAAPRLRIPAVHGGGCVLASLIAGRVALGADLVTAVRWSKKVHHAALAAATDVGGDLRVLLA